MNTPKSKTLLASLGKEEVITPCGVDLPRIDNVGNHAFYMGVEADSSLELCEGAHGGGPNKKEKTRGEVAEGPEEEGVRLMRLDDALSKRIFSGEV